MDLSTIKSKLEEGKYEDPWGVSMVSSILFLLN